MRVYLKGYYGYQNIGDEVLLLGVISYLANQHSVTSITLETDQPDWMAQWLERHQSLVPIPVTPIDRNRSIFRKISEAILSAVGLFPTLVLGGGEVINNHLVRPRNGWQYLIQYPGIILQTQRYFILGGVTIDRDSPGRQVRTLLTHADAVILRDQTSYDLAHAISPSNTTHYHDRAYDVLEQIRVPQTTAADRSSYALLNVHPQLFDDQSTLIDTVHLWLSDHAHQQIYFVPGDIKQDKQAYDRLLEVYPHLIRRDRKDLSLTEILMFLSQASDVAASRLHLLLLMQAVGHEAVRLSYHPKIDKVLGSFAS